MYNCLIMGSGRSGTSMLGGVLHDAGYYMGKHLWPCREANPKGFFESAKINGINERILTYYDQPLLRLKGKLTKKYSIKAPKTNQHWLCSIRPEIDITKSDTGIDNDILTVLTPGKPFAYKDPRFSYTLPVWDKYLDRDTKLICIFRSPTATAKSILKECKDAKYLHSLQIDESIALSVWLNIHLHILKNYKKSPERFFFTHYEQILNGSTFDKLRGFLDANLSSDFADASLRRSIPDPINDNIVKSIYAELCRLANFSGS